MCEAEELEDQLAELIQADQLCGKIDSYSQVYTTGTPNERSRAIEATLAAGRSTVSATDSLLLRASCVENRITVTGGLGQRHHRPNPMHPGTAPAEVPSSPGMEFESTEPGGA
eukprot:TRINITY_DN7390_c0_g1_i1.p1 TRINITY_DN7390_c0_g1~~TRINITY_DN7390_c0_g1_i1.p1  ORF type:complete len:113 (-),score=25.74 TRINITY_DN7390_c0_g1_i1:147-485(-)